MEKKNSEYLMRGRDWTESALEAKPWGMRALLLTTATVMATSLSLWAESELLSQDVGLELVESESSTLGKEGYLTFYLDNDIFAGTDEGYTNGVRLSWISKSRDLEDFGLMQNALRHLVGDRTSLGFFKELTGLEDSEAIKYNFGFSLTQLIFTPETLATPTPPPGERPYAGWLGLGYSLHAKDADTLNSAEFSIGMIGPDALGRQTQDFVHKLRGLEQFQGWDSQISNELTLGFSFTQKRRVDISNTGKQQFSVDGLTEWGFSVGNFRTNVFGGTLFRAGYNLQESFSDPRLSLTSYTLEPFQDGKSDHSRWSYYGLMGAQVKGVLFDATLDGPLLRNTNTGVTSESFVAEFYAGFGVRYDEWEFSYVHTFQTKEFEEQRDNLNSFGSLAIRRRF